MEILDLYPVFLIDNDVLFPVLYPALDSNDPVLAVSLVHGKIKEVATKQPVEGLTLDIMTKCADDFDLVIRAAEKLRRSTVAITGLARSGKDTLCDAMLNELPTFRKLSLGDALRSVRKIVYGEGANKDRHELVQIGQGLRKDDERIWIKAWLRQAINLLVAGAQGVIVPDIRQPNEFNYFSQFATTVHIEVSEDARLKILAEADGTKALDPLLLNNETEQFTGAFREKCKYQLTNNYDSNFFIVTNDLVAKLKDALYV